MILRTDDGSHASADDFLTGPAQSVGVLVSRQRLDVIGEAAHHGKLWTDLFKAQAILLGSCADAVDIAVVDIAGQGHVLKDIVAEQRQLIDIRLAPDRKTGFRITIAQKHDAVGIFRSD